LLSPHPQDAVRYLNVTSSGPMDQRRSRQCVARQMRAAAAGHYLPLSERSQGVTLMVNTDGYVLGHSDVELQRLAPQARLIDPITRRFLVSAGVREGMRVLDVEVARGTSPCCLRAWSAQAGK
jgi:hypothetical protein